MKTVAAALAILVLIGAGALFWLRVHGVSARAEPSRVEAFVARRLRSLAIPAADRDLKDPVEPSDDAVADGREHFADHCAVCHANDGSGDTAIGRGLYPKPPDLRKEATQSLSDGEIFWIIQNGVRFTGMPALGGDGEHDTQDVWEIVQFVRHLPKMPAEELRSMERASPRTAHEEHEAPERLHEEREQHDVPEDGD